MSWSGSCFVIPTHQLILCVCICYCYLARHLDSPADPVHLHLPYFVFYIIQLLTCVCICCSALSCRILISVTKQLDVHDTGLVGDGRGRTGDFPTTYGLERADVLGGVYRGRLRAGLGITMWQRARTDALGSHADVHMFIAYLKKT